MQSWNHRNLFNIWRRSNENLAERARPPYTESRMVTFKHTRATLFQQRWKCKALVRGYHGDHINEKVFKRWYLPNSLPDVRPKQIVLGLGDDKNKLDVFARRKANAAKESKRLKEEEEKGMAPVGSLMFAEVERRIDVFVFRCCFAHSVYEARRLVIHGYVTLNGKKVRERKVIMGNLELIFRLLQHHDANTRLAPGDMISVDPNAVRVVQAPDSPKVPETTKDETAETSKESSETSPTTDSSPSTNSPTGLAKYLATLSRSSPTPLTPFHLPPYASPHLFIPAFAQVSFATCSAIYVRHPTARPGYSEIPTPYDADGEIVRLAWEWYSKCRPRMRSKTQLARMPENRKSAEELAVV